MALFRKITSRYYKFEMLCEPKSEEGKHKGLLYVTSIKKLLSEAHSPRLKINNTKSKELEPPSEKRRSDETMNL